LPDRPAFQALCNARAASGKGWSCFPKPHSDTLAHIKRARFRRQQTAFRKRVSITVNSGSALVPDDSPRLLLRTASMPSGTQACPLPWSRALGPYFQREFRSVSSAAGLLGGICIRRPHRLLIWRPTKARGGVIAGITSLMQQPPPPARASGPG